MSERRCIDCGKAHETGAEALGCDSTHGFRPGTRRRITGADRYFAQRLTDPEYAAAYARALAAARYRGQREQRSERPATAGA